jgi:hypothetical protein
MTIAISGTTGITLDGQFNSASSMGFKNRIINGAMVIDARNAGAEVNPAVANAYYVDRWFATSSAASKFKIGQNAGAVTPPTGFINYLGLTSLSAYTVGAAESFSVRQRIEGLNVADLAWGTASASTVTLSFWVYSSLTGTFGGALKNSANNRSYPFSYSIPVASTWTQISITIAGDTSGTWLTTNGTGIQLIFSIGTGSTLSGTAGAWAASNLASTTGAVSVVGTNGATWYVTGVQLEKGSTATSFDYRPYGTELQLAQRFYQFDPYVLWSGNVTNANTYYLYKNFVVPMRVAPTVVYTANGSNLFPNTASSSNQVTFQQLTSQRSSNGTGAGGYFIDSITMSAEL